MAKLFSFVVIFWSLSPLKSLSGTWWQLWATLGERHWFDKPRDARRGRVGRREEVHVTAQHMSTWLKTNSFRIEPVLCKPHPCTAPSKDTPLHFCSLCDLHAECMHTCMNALKCPFTFVVTGKVCGVLQKLKSRVLKRMNTFAESKSIFESTWQNNTRDSRSCSKVLDYIGK